jgi:hypothetical protein
LKHGFCFKEAVAPALSDFNFVIQPLNKATIFSTFKIVGDVPLIFLPRFDESIETSKITFANRFYPSVDFYNARFSTAMGIKYMS